MYIAVTVAVNHYYNCIIIHVQSHDKVIIILYTTDQSRFGVYNVELQECYHIHLLYIVLTGTRDIVQGWSDPIHCRPVYQDGPIPLQALSVAY